MKIKRTGRQKCFNKREKNLKWTGFTNYKEYLESDIWKRIRKEILTKRKYICHFCGNRANQVHHTRYTRNVLLALNKYYPGGLVATCEVCHQKITFYAKKEKIHEEEAFRRFNTDRKKGNDFFSRN